MRYPKLRELKEAIKAVIKGPYTTKFPYEPHVPPEKFRGKPEFYEKDCVGCSACAEVCPATAIEVKDDTRAKPPMRRLVLHFDICIFCGQCQANCITEKGVKLTGEYDLALFNRNEAIVKVEKELLVCEECGKVIGAKDHLYFLASKLGPLAYGNMPLLLTASGELELVKTPPTIGPPLRRAHIFRILCPRCRREVLLEDIWGKKKPEK